MAGTRPTMPTDPLMTKSLRTDYPAPMEREIIDGGVAEGRPETAAFPSLVWLVVLLMLGGIALFAYLWLTTPWFH